MRCHRQGHRIRTRCLGNQNFLEEGRGGGAESTLWTGRTPKVNSRTRTGTLLRCSTLRLCGTFSGVVDLIQSPIVVLDSVMLPHVPCRGKILAAFRSLAIPGRPVKRKDFGLRAHLIWANAGSSRRWLRGLDGGMARVRRLLTGQARRPVPTTKEGKELGKKFLTKPSGPSRMDAPLILIPRGEEGVHS